MTEHTEQYSLQFPERLWIGDFHLCKVLISMFYFYVFILNE